MQRIYWFVTWKCYIKDPWFVSFYRKAVWYNMVWLKLQKYQMLNEQTPSDCSVCRHSDLLFIKNTVGLDSVSYLVSEQFEKVSTPSIIILPSGHLSTINKGGMLMKTPPHMCIHVNTHTSLTQRHALFYFWQIKSKGSHFLKTSLTEPELHNISVGVFFFMMPGSLGEVGDHFITHP